MARGRGYVSTRMEKHETTTVGAAAGLPAFATVETPFQLEGGDEECQIKRLHISVASDRAVQVELYLGDEAMAGAQPIQRLLLNFVCTGAQQVDRTTAIRVPRDWHLLARITNLTGNNGEACLQSTVHYKVLS